MSGKRLASVRIILRENKEINIDLNNQLAYRYLPLFVVLRSAIDNSAYLT